MKSKDYQIETINQQEGHHRMEVIKNVVNMIESTNYFIFITGRACVIRRSKDTWKWVE